MVRVDRIFRTYNVNENPWIVMQGEDFGETRPGII
jgi:hypothetical protein